MRPFITCAVTCALVAFGASLRADDKEVLGKLISANMAEITVSEFAAKNASDEKVKDFANQLVKDHQKIGAKLMELAKVENVAVSPTIEKDSKQKLEKISSLKGKDFDLAYVQEMITDHEKAIDLLETASKSTNKDVQTCAKEALPDVKKHLEEARDLQARLKK